jgi:hypothetical protein
MAAPGQCPQDDRPCIDLGVIAPFVAFCSRTFATVGSRRAASPDLQRRLKVARIGFQTFGPARFPNRF